MVREELQQLAGQREVAELGGGQRPADGHAAQVLQAGHLPRAGPEVHAAVLGPAQNPKNIQVIPPHTHMTGGQAGDVLVLSPSCSRSWFTPVPILSYSSTISNLSMEQEQISQQLLLCHLTHSNCPRLSDGLLPVLMFWVSHIFIFKDKK